MGQSSQRLAVDVLAFNRVQLRIVTNLLTGQSCLRKYLHRIGIPKGELIAASLFGTNQATNRSSGTQTIKSSKRN